MAERRNAGFLLVEALVSVGLAAVLLTALLRSFGSTWSGVNLVREEASAMIVARAVLESASPRANIRPGVQDGTSGRYAWRIAITPVPLDEASIARQLPPGVQPVPANYRQWMVYRMNVIVRGPSGRRTVLETMRLGLPLR